MWFLSLALAAAPAPVTLPATGRHEAVFSLKKFGRYAIAAESSQGTQIRVVDRMAGLLAERGRPGEKDGRADLFLDRGEVKVVTVADPAGTGQVTVRVQPFSEPPPPALLVPERPVASTLADLETRAYWLDLSAEEASQIVALEASGRYLGDLRLWREGTWLVDAQPGCARFEPVPGQPWTRCSLITRLEAGLYLVTAYGGPGEPWTEDIDTQPFELQWGWPELPTAGQMVDKLGQTGFVRYRLPSAVRQAHVALPDVAPFELTAGGLEGSYAGRRASITSESRRPLASLDGLSGGLVTLTGAPGQPFTFTWFPAPSSELTLSEPGRWWVSTVSPADPADVHEPTAVLWRRTREGHAIRAAAQGLPLSSSVRVERRFNLAEPTRLLLDVTETGPYVLWVEGLRTQLSLAPFLVDSDDKIVPFEPEQDELRLDLERGLYILTLTPKSPGIATLHMGHDSWFSRARRGLGASGEAVTLRPAIQMPLVEVEPGGPLTMQLFSAPSAPQGVVIRSLPIDPRDALPITLLPGEEITVPIQAHEAGKLSFTTPRGMPLPIRLDGAPASGSVLVSPGSHQVLITNTTSSTVLGSLSLVPTRMAPQSPLPALPPGRLEALPRFRELASDKPLGLDLEAGAQQTFKLDVARSGLWILETTGLLATEGALRTRTQTRLLAASANGIGRNFEISAYLRQGDYQLTVNTLSPSEGHAGLRLRPGPIHDGGEIRDTTPARVTVPAGTAVSHAIVISAPGNYRLIQHGQTRLFPCRLEDEGGWPLLDKPEQPCSLTLWLEPGTYRLLGLPTDVESRRITTVTPTAAAPAPRSGHGPFALALGVPASHVWTEPADGGERLPDVWTVELPAAVTASVRLSAEMTGELKAGGSALARLVPGETWTGAVPKGTVQIEVRGARRNTGVPYSLSFEPVELVSGAQREVSVPSRVPVAVDSPGVYTFDSDGSVDVRARLLDERGQVVAANDDRPDDWNFRLSARLSPGRYTLLVDPVAPVDLPRLAPPTRGSPSPAPYTPPSDTGLYEEPYEEEPYEEEPYEPYEDESYEDEETMYEEFPPYRARTGSVRVSMRAPREVEAGTLQPGKSLTVRPGADALLHEVDGRVPEIAVARAISGENVGIALEVKEGQTWRSLSHGTGREAIAVARLDKHTVRVRTWSEDGRGGPVEIRVDLLRARHISASSAAEGVGLGEITALAVGGGAGQYALEGDARVWACGPAGEGCPLAQARWASAPREGLVLVGQKGTLAVQRVQLLDGQPVALPLLPEPLLLDLQDPGMVAVEVRAAEAQPQVRFQGGTGSLVVQGAALALRPRGSEPARLWVDGAPGDGRVVAHTIADSRSVSLQEGATVLTVKAREALSLGLGGQRDVVASLEAGLFVLEPGGRGQWAEPGPVAAHLRAARGPLLLVNPTDTDKIAHLDVRASQGEARLVHGSPHERVHGASEIWSVIVPRDQPDAVLEVRGRAEATLLREDGQVLRGSSLPIGPGGILSLSVQPGPVLAWVARPGESGPLRQVQESAVLKPKAGATVPLRGEAVRLELDAPEPGAFSLVAPCPMVAVAELPGGTSRTAVLQGGDRLDLWVSDPKKPAIVHLRSFADTALYGDLVSSHAPAIPIGEGLGPEVLLAPGGSAWFSFRVERQGPVGLGASARAERVEAVLHDATGRELARGLLLLQELAPGDYLLSLSQPPGSAPVRARPALVGLVPPPTTPPIDIVQRYRALAGETP